MKPHQADLELNRSFSVMSPKDTGAFALLRVDHMVIETEKADEVTQLFLDKLKFRRCCQCEGELLRGECRIKIRSPVVVSSLANHELETRTQSRLSNASSVGSVTDVAFVVADLDSFVDRVRVIDRQLLLEDVVKVERHPRLGAHKRALVKSVVGNVMHTLIEIDPDSLEPEAAGERQSSSRDALNSPAPGDNFAEDRDSAKSFGDEVSDLDHIAFACRVGESEGILRWYEDIFQMKSFDFGEGGDGIRIQVDDIGMQLKALEFWRCAEKGLYAKHSPRSKFPLLVVAEPLPGVDTNNQIDVFVSEHGGPGVQHIGINTTDICRSKEYMRQRGVSFIEPPPTYYREGAKLEDIIKAGESPSKLQEHGILIDYEDYNGSDVPGLESGYLMQVFTKPIFAKRTFFLELIERRGARGFGAGNITALFKAVQSYMRQES